MKRKEFLKLSSAGVAGLTMGGLTPYRSATETQRKGNPQTDLNLKKGFMLQTFPSRDQYSLAEQFRMLKEAGFSGVEPESGLNRDDVLEAKEASGLDIPSVVVSTHWTNPLTHPDPAVRQAGMDGVRTAMGDAHAYGASVILLVPGIVNEDVSYDTAYRRSREQIRELIPLAEELDVVIAIENVWNQFLMSPLEAARFVDEFDSPHVGWYLDAGNLINYGYPEQWIRILGDRIAMVHIKEFSRQKRDDEGLWQGFRVNLTEGSNNWPGIMNALRQTGYSGYAIAEQSYREEGVSDEEWLREHISGKMDQILLM
ncbi:sugar phosphate isomerase/epimerase family protein [Rhodohalobacter mucosus]|uniref:Xylose isomerase n=1 Tax=Rhodohalobacter mucosus TaxID=2079485 RepID=A0A316TQD7_9BACT|nr:sugar phosphate isomerase/epimerase family protein [Rhodohalobacter mucosus]PWN05439.1 xylose isomerase [Rhodohalobacter mucosus]